MSRTLSLVLALTALALAGCGGGGADVCANADHALSTTAFVFVEQP